MATEINIKITPLTVGVEITIDTPESLFKLTNSIRTILKADNPKFGLETGKDDGSKKYLEISYDAVRLLNCIYSELVKYN